MGLRLSKSIRFGAVRFNLSSSGIGVSAGIPGLRVGAGPRGAYISGGLGAFRYRKSLGRGRAGSNSTSTPTSSPRPGHATRTGTPGLGLPQTQPVAISRTAYDTSGVLELSDASSEGVLQTIREQRSRMAYWPFTAVASVLALFALALATPQLPSGVFAFAAVTAVAGTLWTRWRDRLRRLTVLFYELDDESAARFEALSHAVHSAALASEFTAVTERVTYADKKYHSGADHGVSTRPASASSGFPDGLVANVAVPMLHAEKTTLAFLPDLVLLIQGSDIGAVEYQSLRIECRPVTIIESTANAPSDATVIGHNWKYPNKDGGPDRRFKDNYQLPKCRYSELALTTGSGLNLRFMSSRDQGMEPLAVGVSRMTGDGAGRRTPAAGVGSDHPDFAHAGAVADTPPRSDLLQTIAVGILAFGVLFGGARGIAAYKVADEAGVDSSSAIVASAAEDALASQKAISDAQPSFDCHKARSVSERLICSSTELATLDRGLAQHFDATRGAIAEGDRKAFAAEARKAWQGREAHCRDVACLTEWYRTRTTQLDAWDARLTAAAVNPPLEHASGTQQMTFDSSGPGLRAVAMASPDAPRPEVFRPTTSFCASPKSDAQRIICSDIDLGNRQSAVGIESPLRR